MDLALTGQTVVVTGASRGEAVQAEVADVPERVWHGMGLSVEDALQLRGLLDRLLLGLDASSSV